ncbi:Spo0E family sporulation regulatory protein-aspartic acid phosphatase [Paenibacillus qinlingensis]|nr:Spo0E family sporulation regulatory protein-aspartic acid phosphatase [Paenibacillus qinlingensis]
MAPTPGRPKLMHYPPVCSVLKCNNTIRSKGLCSTHYQRIRRNGNLDIYRTQLKVNGILLEVQLLSQHLSMTKSGSDISYDELIFECRKSMDLKPYINKQIDIYKKMLDYKVQSHNSNLQHPEIIILSKMIDILILCNWTL